MWTTPTRCPQSHEAEQNQKKRTYEVLPKPDNLIRYRHARQAVHVILAEPTRQLGIALARLQHRIAANALDLVQKNAPARKAGRSKKTRCEPQPLTSELGFPRRPDVEQFRRPVRAQPGLDHRRVELAAPEEPGDARVIFRAEV